MNWVLGKEMEMQDEEGLLFLIGGAQKRSTHDFLAHENESDRAGSNNIQKTVQFN